MSEGLSDSIKEVSKTVKGSSRKVQKQTERRFAKVVSGVTQG